MNRFLILAGAALLLSAMFAPALATTGGSGPQPPIVVGPGQTGTNGDVNVTNGEDSRGKIRIKTQGGGNTETKCDGSVRATITDIDQGDTVITGPNSTITVVGTGGSVAVGSGSAVTITNTSLPGGTSITATVPGGSTITILPGMTVPITG